MISVTVSPSIAGAKYNTIQIQTRLANMLTCTTNTAFLSDATGLFENTCESHRLIDYFLLNVIPNFEWLMNIQSSVVCQTNELYFTESI